MSAWWALLPAGLTFAAGAWLSYAPRPVKEAWYYPWALAFLGGAAGWVWAWATRRTEGAETYRLSAAWDTLMVLAYYALPLALTVRADWRVFAGAALAVAGCLLMRDTPPPPGGAAHDSRPAGPAGQGPAD